MADQLIGARDDDPLVEVDTRGRISLGRYARHKRYALTMQPDSDRILLTPVRVIPVELAHILTDADATQRVRRGRPQRKPEGTTND